MPPLQDKFAFKDRGERYLRLDSQSCSNRPSACWAGAFYNRLRAAGGSVGIFGSRPHSLRHTSGTRLGERDVNVKKIRRLTGHAGIKMTLSHVHPDEGSLRAAVGLAAGKSPGIVPGEAAAGRRGGRKALKAVG